MNLKEFLEKIARNKSSRKVVKFAYICNVTSLRSLMLYWKFQLQGKHSLPNIAWHNKIILTIVVCVCKCIWKLLIWIYTLELSRVKGHTIYIYGYICNDPLSCLDNCTKSTLKSSWALKMEIGYIGDVCQGIQEGISNLCKRYLISCNIIFKINFIHIRNT